MILLLVLLRLLVKVGDLVKITRKAIGVPAGTLGLIVSIETPDENPYRLSFYTIKIVGQDRRHRRYLREDLRPI